MTFSACRSSWICVSALLCGVVTQAAAQDGALRVRPADRELISSEPRQMVAAAFSVQNLSHQVIEVEARIVLPPHWQLVTPPLPFTLGPGESAAKLVSFTIPEDARAADYSVSYQARDRLRPGSADAYPLSVRVTAASRVQVVLLETPDFAVSGDTQASAVVFRNTGNLGVPVKFNVSGRFITDLEPKQGELYLEPAQSQRVDLRFTAGSVSARSAGRLTVTTTWPGATASVANAAMVVVPRASAFDALRTLDSRAETRFVARDSPLGNTAGWQADISGGGILDEDRRDLLRYHFRGPDLRQQGSFGAAEEYWLRYDSPRVSAGVGDLVYGLSPLTEPGRVGRGTLLEYRGGRWGAMAYGMRDVFGEGNADQFGAGSNFNVTPGTALGINLLERVGASPGRIWSLRARSEWAPNVSAEVEAAQSLADRERGNALRFALRDNRRPVQFYALGWGAEPRFSGPLRDKLYLSTGFDYPNVESWGTRGYYRLQNWNLLPLDQVEPDLRPRLSQSDLMRSSPAESESSLGISHPVGGARATLDVFHRERSGSASPATRVNLQSGSWRAGFNRSWQRLSLFASLERGQAEDRISGERFETSSQMLSGTVRVAENQTYGAWWLRDDNTRLDRRAPRQVSSGVSASYEHAGFQLRVDAQRSESSFGRSAIYDLSLLHQAERGGRLTLAARRMEGRFARTDFLVGYSLPFSMPVARRRDVVALRGRVFDVENSRGLEKVVLRVDGMVTATNRRGEFVFPAVARGMHRILVDRGADVGQVPVDPAPLEVMVSDEAAAPVLIGMVRSVVIEVRVTLTSGEGEAATAASGVLVSFRNGEMEFRRLTDGQGRARLGGVPPGSWSMSVMQDTLPPGYQPQGDALRLDLQPGQAANAELPLARERREMHMLAPLAVQRVGPRG